MAKQRKTKQNGASNPKASATQSIKKEKEPVYTRGAFNAAVIFIAAGFIIQIALAILVYGKLPDSIPTTWVGGTSVTQTMPSWVVFIAFPCAQVVLYAVAFFSHVDDQNKKVMDWGKSISLILLTVLFTALQGSAFCIGK